MLVSRKMVVLVLMVTVVIASVGLWLYSQQIQATGPVHFSIDRSVVKEGANATLTVTIKNVNLTTQVVEFRFMVSDRVYVYEGSEELLPQIGSQYVFNFTLEATRPSETRAFVVVGTLEEDVSSATYPISLTVYLDGKELKKTWKDLTLKVEE